MQLSDFFNCRYVISLLNCKLHYIHFKGSIVAFCKRFFSKDFRLYPLKQEAKQAAEAARIEAEKQAKREAHKAAQKQQSQNAKNKKGDK